MSDEFLKSKRWQRLREAVLQRDGYECQMAKARGKSEPAQCVHHIFPRSQYPEYRWCDWNLISLSLSAHNQMHIRDTELLTERGQLLLEATAEKRGITYDKQVILIIGFPGSGKTTVARQRLKNGVCYDLDAIAGALRLRGPKTEKHKAARWLANSLFQGFADAAKTYSRRVLIIRTAPSIDDIQSINPNEIIICRGGYGNEDLTDERRHTIAARIQEAERYARHNNIKITEIEDYDHRSQ